MSDLQARNPTMCITVDFDATSFWFMVGSTDAHGISRGDYGAEVGTPRLLDLFERLGIPTTWFIPGHTIDNYRSACERVRDAGHEIGHHGYLHENFVALSRDQARVAIQKGSQAIERLTGSPPSGFRVTGDFKQELYLTLAEAGLTYTSALFGEHYARWARSPDTFGEDGAITRGGPLDLVELPLNVNMTDFRYFEISLSPALPAALVNPRHVEEVWRDEFDYACEHAPAAYTMMALHPQSIGWGGRMLMLERFLRYCQSKPGIRFVDAQTLASEFRSSEEGAATNG